MKFRDTPEDSGRGARRIPRPRKGNQADPGLDQWLSKRLHDYYDPVLGEKIPDDLARLLEDFAKRPDDKTD